MPVADRGPLPPEFDGDRYFSDWEAVLADSDEPTADELAISGFVAEGARFLGFIARGGKERDAALEGLVGERGAVVIYEAGNRTPALLRDLAKVVPERRVVIARELSKLHQEVLRGTAGTLLVCRT